MQLTTGQVVSWPAAPRGFAQVDELLRSRVRLYYVTKTGRARRPVVRVAEPQTGDVLPFPDPFRRAGGLLKRSREYSTGSGDRGGDLGGLGVGVDERVERRAAHQS